MSLLEEKNEKYGKMEKKTKEMNKAVFAPKHKGSWSVAGKVNKVYSYVENPHCRGLSFVHCCRKAHNFFMALFGGPSSPLQLLLTTKQWTKVVVSDGPIKMRRNKL